MLPPWLLEKAITPSRSPSPVWCQVRSRYTRTPAGIRSLVNTLSLTVRFQRSSGTTEWTSGLAGRRGVGPAPAGPRPALGARRVPVGQGREVRAEGGGRVRGVGDPPPAGVVQHLPAVHGQVGAV